MISKILSEMNPSKKLLGTKNNISSISNVVSGLSKTGTPLKNLDRMIQFQVILLGL